MIKVNVSGCNSFVKDADYQNYVQKALAAYDTLANEDGAGNDFLGWKTLPVDVPESLICEFEAIRDDWKAKGVNLVIAIGIGGSYLGAKCAIEALSHSFIEPATKVVFAGNNLSEEYLAELMDLAKVRNVACVVISKSGTTTEPAVAFRIVKEYIEGKYGKQEAAERIVAITDAVKGALKTLSTQEGYKTFIVPDNVGGRYSVLTPVGLLPIVLAGFDVRAMLKGAAAEREELLKKGPENAAVKYAAMRNLLHSGLGKAVEILVTYNPKFTYFAEWWKQLYGESEGKDGLGIYPAAFLYLYILTTMQVNQKRTNRLKWTILAINAGMAAVYFITRDLRWSDNFTFVLLSVEVVMFSIIGLRVIIHFRKQLLNFYSNSEGMYLKSLVYTFLTFMILSAIKMASIALGIFSRDNIWFIGFFSISFTMVFYAVAYGSSKRTFTGQKLQDDITAETVLVPDQPEVDTADMTRHEVAERIINVMDREKLYLKTGLSIIDVARSVGSNRTYVSESINTVMNQSFNDFINSMRVSHAMDLMKGYPRKCISDIAVESGFASDAAFYRNFRKFAGESPSSWLSKNLTNSN